jgi:prepilin-type N-terminal cleavage/methylation domain-containing protein
MRVGANLTEGRMSRFRARAFTLMEVLVVVGILAVLATLTVPLVSRLRESARRAEDLSHLRQLAAATLLYAGDNDGALPPGRMTSPSAYTDDYSWISYKNCWKPLLDRVPALASMTSCASVRTGHDGIEKFGQPDIDPEYPDDTIVGWIYWGGRDDLTAGGVVKYRSPRHIRDRFTPGSNTLWTCWCWDANGTAAPSIAPHVGSRYVEYPPGVPLKPTPDGLGVVLTDGSASFVPWPEMIIIPQANGFKLYYQP